MDTSPLNEWQYARTRTHRSGGDLSHDGELLREIPGSLTGYPSTSSDVYYDAHAFRATIALPPRRSHAGRLTNREGKTENPRSPHTWRRIVSVYRGVSNRTPASENSLDLSRDTICI